MRGFRKTLKAPAALCPVSVYVGDVRGRRETSWRPHLDSLMLRFEVEVVRQPHRIITCLVFSGQMPRREFTAIRRPVAAAVRGAPSKEGGPLLARRFSP